MSLKLNSSGGGSVTLQEPTTASNVTLNLPAADGTVVYENASGNVGVGTPSPQKKFVVSNSGAAGVEIDPFTRSATTGGSLLAYNRSGAAFVRMDYDASEHIFFTSTSERARIDSSGNLLVGTTTLQQDGKVSIQYTPSSNRGMVFRTTSDTSANPIAFANAAGTIVGTITTTASATAYNTSSDYRLKENVQPMTGALAKVAALKPVTYKWKSDGSDGEGFIAHELQAVCPDAVTGEKDAVDADGNPVYQGIDTSFLVATLTAAIQELKAEVDALRAQVEAK